MPMMTTAMSALTMDTAKAKMFFEQEMAYTTGPVELNRMRQNQPEELVVVDVRAPEDYRAGHVPGAVNLPREQWETLGGLRKDRVNVLYCYSIVCHLAKAAAVEFAGKGYPVMEMEGGFRAWQDAELEIER
jgi:rhodanese-related sulfurtransferase